MATLEVCCAAGQPIRHDYQPVGKVEDMGGGLAAYVVTGTKPGAVIWLPDIFGYTEYPQIKQTCDHMSGASGFTVVIPDTWRGKGYDKNAMSNPPTAEQRAALMAWIEEKGNFEQVSRDVHQIVGVLKGRGISKFGIGGACWGAAPAMQLGADAGTYSAVGMVHPSLFGREQQMAAAVKVPVALIAAKGDPCEAVQEALAAASPGLASKSIFRRFDDVIHGFTAARGDFKDPLVCQRVAEAAQLLGSFFAANMA